MRLTLSFSFRVGKAEKRRADALEWKIYALSTFKKAPHDSSFAITLPT